MYNKYLDAFITAADCGSLSKAAEAMFLSSTAIMKQINQLERHLGIQLFIRTNKGIQLSEAGKSLYQDAKYMIRFSNEAIDRARAILQEKDYVIRIGTSMMNPVQKISGLLQSVSKEDARFQFHIVPFDDYKDSYEHMIQHLGDQIDLIAGVYGFSTWTSTFHNTLQLEAEPICIAFSGHHPFNEKKNLEIKDLYGQSVFITEPGQSSYLDTLYKEMNAHHPQIRFVPVRTYDMTLFNQCEHSNSLILTIPSWVSLHPMLKMRFVNWKYTVPYGIIYPLQPSSGVEAFIRILQKVHNTGRNISADNILLPVQ